MTTKLHRESTQAVIDWCKKNKIKLTRKPCHVYPRVYVIGYAAPQCLVVARCWIDSEPQIRWHVKDHPIDTIRKFDKSLKPGDWCITAYVCTESSGEPVAIPIEGMTRPEPLRLKRSEK